MPTDPYYQKRLKKSRAERKKRSKIRTLSEEIRSTSRMLIIAITGLFLITSISFFYVSSMKAGKGYTLQQLQLEYEELQSDNREILSELQEAQSIVNLESSEEVDAMDEPENDSVSYVGDPGDLASAE
tara:strand:+ start:105 stop:488 length:384 start_codon:yes stop_codon:yes gene_type:complete